MPAAVALLLMAAVCGGQENKGLDAIRAVIGEIKVKIEHKEESTAAKDHRPPLKSESWIFQAGGVNPTVRYGRYLNRPPEFNGSYPSLVSGDMGVGLDGGPFGHWYRGNAIRVLLDGRDVLAERPASRIETQERVNGHLRLIWELEKQRRVVLHLTVPKDGREHRRTRLRPLPPRAAGE